MNDQEIKSKFPVRSPLTIGILAVTILVGGFGGWASMTEISGAIIASGQIQVDQNRQIVQHPDGGVVSEILVDEGDTVEEGDTLIRLDPTLLRTDLTVLEGQLFELIARRGRLEAERDESDTLTFDPILVQRASENEEVDELMEGQRRLFEARLRSIEKEGEQLAKRRDQISSQVSGIEAQQAALREQLALIAQELESQQSLLDRGLAQAARVLGLQREQARLSGSMGELAARKGQAEQAITETEIQILKLATTRREEAITRLRDQQFQELELAERRRAILEQLSRMDIRAPVSGVIYGMTVFAPRSVIRPADPLLYIVPQDRPLVISAQVPPIHIDQLHVGQEVHLRFSALDQRQTPELFGFVTQISADAFTDEGTRATYYRTEIQLNEGERERLPEGASLIPGMPVEAFIRTQDRTPIAYLVKPLADYFAKAFRES